MDSDKSIVRCEHCGGEKGFKVRQRPGQRRFYFICKLCGEEHRPVSIRERALAKGMVDAPEI